MSEEVGGDRTLLVLCSAFRGNADRWQNLTVKKIPNHIRSRCEWSHDDYSLNVESLPTALPGPEPEPEPNGVTTLNGNPVQPELFGARSMGRR